MPSRSDERTTFEILEDLANTHDLGRHDRLPPDVARHAAHRIRRIIVEQRETTFGQAAGPNDASALDAHLEEVCRALNAFLVRLKSSSVVALYGRQFARSCCHAIFGADIQLSVYRDRGNARRLLLIGETGTGKEAIARVLSQTLLEMEDRRGSFQSFNAAAVSDALADSELFGHVRGAYTGASKDNPGLISSVGDGGVLFLDEVSEASPSVQAKLLRVVQSGEYKAVGSLKTLESRFHVVAATNRSEREIRSGSSLRLDLFYRLARPSVSVPPLRALLAATAHPSQIFTVLINHVLTTRLTGRAPQDGFGEWVDGWRKSLAKDIASRTAGYSWPGNLRECTAFIEEAIYQGPAAIPALCTRLSDSERAHRSTDAAASVDGVPLRVLLDNTERSAYVRAAEGAITLDAVAKRLGVARQTASRRLAHFGIVIRPRLPDSTH